MNSELSWFLYQIRFWEAFPWRRLSSQTTNCPHHQTLYSLNREIFPHFPKKWFAIIKGFVGRYPIIHVHKKFWIMHSSTKDLNKLRAKKINALLETKSFTNSWKIGQRCFSRESKTCIYAKSIHDCIAACQTNRIMVVCYNPFNRRSHSKGTKQIELHLHQTKTKPFIAKLFVHPMDSWKTLWICMGWCKLFMWVI